MSIGPLRPARSRGYATLSALVIVAMCSMIGASSLLSHIGASGEARTSLASERAFQAADAGVDWGIARLRITRGAVPVPAEDTCDVGFSASAVVRYEHGNMDGLDEDDDGVVDEPDEAVYTLVTSTGSAGRVRRTVQVLVRRTPTLAGFPSAVFVNDDLPIVDLSGGAFQISGTEHLLDGSADTTQPAKFGISSPGTISTLLIDLEGHASQIGGAGGTPSTSSDPEMQLERLIEEALQATTIVLAPGTRITDETFGTTQDMQVVACDGDLELAGRVSGAGVLVVTGDLTISGGFEWTGFILCSGRVRMTGGGSGTVLTGSLLCGQELRISGTVEIHYSSEAIGEASLGLAVPVVLTWRETGNP